MAPDASPQSSSSLPSDPPPTIAGADRAVPRRNDADLGQVKVVRGDSRRRRGPKTAAGKARVALNALTHGITSAKLIVPGDSSTDWETYRRTIGEALAPVGPVEMALADRVASGLWRLRRVTAYEEAAIAERQHLETASARLLPHPAEIDKIIRYEAHLSRQFVQALHEFEAMRAERHGQAAPLVRVDIEGPADTRAVSDGASA